MPCMAGDHLPSKEDAVLRERVLPLVTARRSKVAVAIEHLGTGDSSIDVQRSKQFRIARTTANEKVTLLRLLSEQRLASPPNTKLMMAPLASCSDRHMLAHRFFHAMFNAPTAGLEIQ